MCPGPASRKHQRYRVEIARDATFSDVLVAERAETLNYSYTSSSPVYVRVVALYPKSRESEPSNVVAWHPDKDYLSTVMGALAIIFAVIVL